MGSDSMMTARAIAGRFNLRRLCRSWRGRCPACDYPGAFSVREGNGGRALLYCASCQDQAAVTEAVARATGQETRRDGRNDADKVAGRLRKGEAALRLWGGSEPAAGTLADRYLISRGLPGLAASLVLRFREDTPHPEGGRLPALVALVQNVAGQPVAVHRTFLARDGTKARVEPNKASLGPIWGAAIRLHRLSIDAPLVIGEGIESAASAGCLMDCPAWAALSAGNMAKGLALPSEALRVVVAADADQAGEHAACAAARRWSVEGRTVQIARPTGGGDFNDIIRQLEHG